MKVISNLTGFFQCPFQLIMDINEQLHEPNPELRKLVFTPLCELNTTNDWINLEALGNPTILRADAMIQQLSASLINQDVHNLAVHINLHDRPLVKDNVFALLFLADKLQQIDIHFYTQYSQINVLEDDIRILQTKPNVAIQVHFEKLIDVNLIQLAKQRTELLKPIIHTMSDSWLEQTEITPANMGGLISYSWTCLKAGSFEPACHIIEYVLAKTQDATLVKEMLFMHLQLIRFLSHQYLAVTNSTFPEQFYHIQHNDQINLYFIKAYSATLCRNLAVAESYFKKANIDSNLPMTDETSLYRLNLHALFLVLSGDTNSALSQEIKIENYINKNNINILGLKYVNFINIARVYKKLGQYNKSFDYYEKAYNEIREGGFTAADHIYYNINLGGLCEASGELEKAFFYWVKAALHWQVLPNPYALAWRPRLILCQEKVTDILKPLSIDKVDQFLLEKINSLLIFTQIQFDKKPLPDLHFITESSSQREACYIADNIILYKSSDKSNKKSSPLNHLLSNIVRNIMHIEDNTMTLQVDSHHDDLYPNLQEACLTLSAYSGCTVFYYQGKRIQFDANQVDDFLSAAKIKLSSIIHSYQPKEDGIYVQFHRSFLNKKLENSIDIERVANNEMAVIKRLINDKVLVFEPG